MTIIYGAGKIGKRALNEVGKENVAFFIDNNVSGVLEDIPVYSFSDAVSRIGNKSVILAIADFAGVKAQLEQNGIMYELYHEIADALPKNYPEIQHLNWNNYLADHYNKKGVHILEIGSRNERENKNDHNNVRSYFPNATYVGVDVLPGLGVDIVGDAHRLSSYFKKDEKFDLVVSSAVFEHLAMPWIVSREIAKVLNVGGGVFIETHFAYANHGRPCDFFRFTDVGLQVLFPSEMGFEVVKSTMSNPLESKFRFDACGYLADKPVNNMWCHSEILVKKVRDVPEFSWDAIDPSRIVERLLYPR